MTFIVGPSASNHFYNARDELMSQKEVYGYSVPTFGNDVVFAVDEKVRAEQFQLLATALRSNKMSSYVPEFVRESREFFKGWEQQGEIDFLDIFNELILFTASSTIMGKEVRENVFKEVTDLYHQLDQGTSSVATSLSLPASWRIIHCTLLLSMLHAHTQSHEQVVIAWCRDAANLCDGTIPAH